MSPALPNRNRLRNRREFQRVYGQRRQRLHPLLVLYHAPSWQGPDAPVRLGITVSRRVARSAVARNRLRRVWREAARLAAPQLAPGRDIVLNARRDEQGRLRVPRAHEVLLRLAAEEGLLAPEGSE